ncbi:MAG: hypothetical protein ACXQTY_03080 [Candidatus Methanogasteraceae archaeon]
MFADAVRTASNTYGISDEACHWMAVLAMDQYGHYLADGTDASRITDIREGSIRAGVSVLLVYDLLKRFDSGEGSEGGVAVVAGSNTHGTPHRIRSQAWLRHGWVRCL